jgi:hypothetical protein
MSIEYGEQKTKSLGKTYSRKAIMVKHYNTIFKWNWFPLTNIIRLLPFL